MSRPWRQVRQQAGLPFVVKRTSVSFDSALGRYRFWRHGDVYCLWNADERQWKVLLERVGDTWHPAAAVRSIPNTEHHGR